MKNTNKKGFTIVELVIVIAVIAILAAVLIPTFVGLVNKANLASDQVAVNTMNKFLATYTDGVNTIADVKAKLSADNIDADDYKPLTKDHDFFWVPSLNSIVLVNASDEVVYPENLKSDAENAKATWVSLSGIGNKEAYDSIVNDVKLGKVVLTGTTNMMGASINLNPTATTTTIGGTSDATATIVNAVSDEGSKVNATGEYKDHTYYAGLISEVKADQTVTVENLVIDGAVVGDTTNPKSARAGIIAGQVDGTLIIKNVTIKNSTVFASFRVGALVGAVSKTGKVVIENVTIENTTVKGGTLTAALIGQVTPTSQVTINNLTTTNINVVASEFNNAITDTSKISTDANGDKWVDIDGIKYPYLTDKDYWLGSGAWDTYYANSGSKIAE